MRQRKAQTGWSPAPPHKEGYCAMPRLPTCTSDAPMPPLDQNRRRTSGSSPAQAVTLPPHAILAAVIQYPNWCRSTMRPDKTLLYQSAKSALHDQDF